MIGEYILQNEQRKVTKAGRKEIEKNVALGFYSEKTIVVGD